MDSQPVSETARIATDAQSHSTSVQADAPVINGDYTSPVDSQAAPTNADAFAINTAQAAQPTMSLKENINPAPSIPAVADIVQPTTELTEPVNSHPTPPPEPVLETKPREITPAVEQAAAEPIKPEAPVETSPITAAPKLASTETSMQAPPSDTLLNGVTEVAPSPLASAAPAELQQSIQVEAPPSLVRPREDDEDDIEPESKRAKIDEAEIKPLEISAQPAAPSQDVVMADAPQPTIEPATPVSTTSAPAATYSTTPLTDLQKSFLVEKTKNLKKTKHATMFLIPVDAEKLNIPNYPNIVKNPMDLSTLETKLKNDQYSSAQDYAHDFTLIVSNSRLFNGDAHPVTIAALNMEATFKKYMSTLPGPQEVAVPKAAKRASPAAPRPQPRREARQPLPAPVLAAPVSPKSAGPVQTFALQPDGTPQIRRDSTTKRPHRTIKPPHRELPYAKPRRKEHMLELKFCEFVLEKTRGPEFAHVNHVFQVPVDPVALNIPHYRQIVKKPMDLATMAQKLKSGQYGTAKEFKADFELMIANCMAFNPPGNAVHDLGIEFRRGFENLWKDKEKWERANKKSSERASSASDSEEEEEEEEDDDDPAASARETIAALTKQLAELQKTVAAAYGAKDGKKKSKDGKKSKKGSFSGATKTKSTSKSKLPKKLKPLSYDEKQEISNAVGQMNEAQVGKLTQIITDNCEKYRNMGDDMELEIDDLPNDVQALLLKHVRSIFGNPNKGARAMSPDDLAAEDDDDFAPPARDRAAMGNKRKKHKPMGKKEQQDNIAALRNRLAAFDEQGRSESPTNAGYTQTADDTSGDEESEESEEE